MHVTHGICFPLAILNFDMYNLPPHLGCTIYMVCSYVKKSLPTFKSCFIG